MLKDFSPRPYQSEIFATACEFNTLVVLPTGLGKTAIAMMLAARRLLLFPDSKVIILAPTKPLAQQHLDSFKDSFLFPDDAYALFTGTVSPAKREELFSTARIIFSTPQTIENDVLSGSFSLREVSLLIADEAHRAVGDYAYVFLANKYMETATHPRLLALTASPGTDAQKINEVSTNLFIERVEYRKPSDPQIKQFSQNTDVRWMELDLPDNIVRIVKYLNDAYASKIATVRGFGFVHEPTDSLSKTSLLNLQQSLHGQIAGADTSPELLQSISLLAEALKLQHALELAQSQSLHALHEYMYSTLSAARTSRTKAVKNLARDPSFLSAFSLTRDALQAGKEHPKIATLCEQVRGVIKDNPKAKVIVFAHFRDTALKLESQLKDDLSVSVFFGQAKKNGVGFSQKKQKEVLDEFRAGNIQVLIATSVAEEGLDIPSVDHVFFYEPVPSAIRAVQRRGRTGRHSKGFVTVLVTRNTRDQANRWSSFHKEKRMYAVLETLSTSIEPSRKSQLSLDVFERETRDILEHNQLFAQKKNVSDVSVVADYREKGSPVLKALLNLGVDLKLKQLAVGDFVLSSDVCVEFKNTKDFLDSIVDGRLLVQLRSLSQYKKPLFVLEGEQDFSHLRRVDQAAMHGMLATIALSYRIPIIRTFSPLETAKLLLLIARQEQESDDTTFTYHGVKPLDDKTMLEYVVGSFPQIGGALARALLERFDSLTALLSASKADLLQVPQIGEKKADELLRVFALSYKSTKPQRFSKPV